MRRVLWEPPAADTAGSPEQMGELVSERLRALGAREWQIELTAEPLTEAILRPSGPPVVETDDEPDEPETESEPETETGD